MRSEVHDLYNELRFLVSVSHLYMQIYASIHLPRDL